MKSKPLLTALLAVTIVVAALALAALTWANYRFAQANPGGNDFLTRWIGMRALLRGESPYSDAVALEAQMIIHGRPALPGEDAARMPYPLYLALVFGPFGLVADYDLARALWMTFLELGLLALAPLALKVIDWQPPRAILYPFILFSVVWYHGIRTLINGNVVAVIAVFWVAALWAMRARRDGAAGVLLALATIKPQVAFLPCVWTLLWMIANRRWRSVVWFAGSLAGMILAGMILIPNWPLLSLIEMAHYTSYTPPTTVGAALAVWFPSLGEPIGWVISLIVAGALIYVWRRGHSSFDEFVWSFVFTLVASQWIGIPTDPGNFIIFILPIALLLEPLSRRPLGWAWVNLALAVLFVGLWVLFLATVDRARGNLQSPVMFFPLPLILFAGLGYLKRSRGAQ